ncbi:MAG: 5'-methylthioadenosine/S-adenosylhomocysteine nucleosidase [Oscillospiraceae bacterium]|nr:5'-methylthioadenosine/S-adenosylhomocysteine nucleosidase [Oscillospiraceae bacterium]MBP1571198.1 5'-methylthioadenosine/S-adenosylhomocysteine nucleosidase [Oscillospiraceae bacterium]
MKTIGMIVAVEIKAVLDRYGSQLEEKNVAGYRILEYKTDKYNLVIAKCGAGEIAAAGCTQFIISEYKPDMIINFGVVGGLTAEMAKTKTCVVEKVVHYDFDTSAVDNWEVGRYAEYPDPYIPTNSDLLHKAIAINPELMPVICASADKFIADPQLKANLNKQFGAHICEMEAAGIVLICNRNNVPCLLIKSVSDSIEGGAEEFRSTINEAAALCLDIADKVISEL